MRTMLLTNHDSSTTAALTTTSATANVQTIIFTSSVVAYTEGGIIHLRGISRVGSSSLLREVQSEENLDQKYSSEPLLSEKKPFFALSLLLVRSTRNVGRSN